MLTHCILEESIKRPKSRRSSVKLVDGQKHLVIQQLLLLEPFKNHFVEQKGGGGGDGGVNCGCRGDRKLWPATEGISLSSIFERTAR